MCHQQSLAEQRSSKGRSLMKKKKKNGPNIEA